VILISLCAVPLTSIAYLNGTLERGSGSAFTRLNRVILGNCRNAISSFVTQSAVSNAAWDTRHEQEVQTCGWTGLCPLRGAVNDLWRTQRWSQICMGSGDTLSQIRNFYISWRLSVSRPGRFAPKVICPRHPLDRELWELRIWSECRGEEGNSFPWRAWNPDSSAAQSVARRYIDWLVLQINWITENLEGKYFIHRRNLPTYNCDGSERQS
jgi:hypothetical protein